MSDFLTHNYHTHTPRCMHAHGSEREYIEAAIEEHMEVLGFSDHIPCPFADGFVSGMRMRVDQAEEYVGCVRALAKEYADQILVLVGFESEYMPQFYPQQQKMCQDLGLDYVILGQHWYGPENTSPYMGAPTDRQEYLQNYVDSILEGLKTGSFLYLAHPDLIRWVGDEGIYTQQMRRLCLACKDMNVPLEINLLGLSDHRHYPAERFWAIAGEAGCRAVLGLDAHELSLMREHETYRRALELADRYHLKLEESLPI